MRVPPMKQMLEYHTWSDRNTNCGVDWVFRASDAFAKKTVYRAYTVTCMCELWIVLLVFPMQQIVGSDMMTRVQTA